MASLEERSLKRFNGEDDDPGKQLKRWIQWTRAKMFTMKDLSEAQKGPWLFTLLDGKALESVEHLSFDDLKKDSGAELVIKALQKRFPEKEAHDQMGEALGEVFGLCSADGESSQQWTARVQEVFLKCQRKASVAFPPEAQGWIALNCCGYNDEQKAIVKAKAQGSLDIEQIAAAMRSCFPTYKATSRSRKPLSALVVDDFPAVEAPMESREEFADVEALLADHNCPQGEEEEVPEQDAAEALAVTWKERRKEITQLQRSRKFAAADSAKKHFRVEIEELKRRTRCRKCNCLGHWARECKYGQAATSSSTTRSTAPTSATSDANLVEHDAGAKEHDVLLAAVPEADSKTEDLPEHQVTFIGSVEQLCYHAQDEKEQPGLVSSPGHGVIDSGCGRTLIGEVTLRQMTEQRGRTRRTPELYESQSLFRFGNGETEQSSKAVRLPVAIGKQVGLIDAAVIRERAPLLLGRPTLERLKVQLDFGGKTMSLLNRPTPIPMAPNEAGQLLVDVMDFPEAPVPTSDARPEPIPESPKPQVPKPQVEPLAARPEPIPESPKTTPYDDRAPDTKPNLKLCPWKSTPCSSECCSAVTKQASLKPKHQRKVRAQITKLLQTPSQDERIAVADLFSPPRFTVLARAQGQTGIAFDKKQGCNLLDAGTQSEVSELLEQAKPALLTACPPCTHWGGWDLLNRCYRTALEQARLVREARRQVRFCVAQIHAQLRRGGDFPV